MIPSLLVVVLPIAYFAGTLYGLHKLNSDSELTVMSAAGFSPGQLLAPVIATAAVVMFATYACGLYLMPFCQRLMKDKEINIRGDIGAAILNEGQFNTPSRGLTVFMRDAADFRELHGRLRAGGVLIPPSQMEAWFVSLAHTEEDVERTLEAAR